jgi:hypothetical protein
MKWRRIFADVDADVPSCTKARDDEIRATIPREEAACDVEGANVHASANIDREEAQRVGRVQGPIVHVAVGAREARLPL